MSVLERSLLNQLQDAAYPEVPLRLPSCGTCSLLDVRGNARFLNLGSTLTGSIILMPIVLEASIPRVAISWKKTSVRSKIAFSGSTISRLLTWIPSNESFWRLCMNASKVLAYRSKRQLEPILDVMWGTLRQTSWFFKVKTANTSTDTVPLEWEQQS